jgi:hypothetical protein
MLYLDRQAFFERLALSLPRQPAIKIGPAPMPSREHKQGLRVMRKTVPAQRLSTAQRSMWSGRFLATQPIASHLRLLMANHLTDVASSDQYTVNRGSM